MTTSAKALRSRNMTAARRSLTLIRDEVTAHLATLEKDEVPDGSFIASVGKYETALAVLRTLDMLGEAAPPPGEGGHDPVEVERNDLYILITLLRQSDMADVLAQAKDGSTISKLLAAIEADEQKES